jgi:N-acetylglucosaminyldiphosphoundecaprenol N-acetyl-beta-D-mannosaminyltransferase
VNGPHELQRGQGMPHPLDVLGTPVTPFLSYQEVGDVVAGFIRCGQKAWCVAINPEKVCMAQRDSELRELTRQAQLQICDGIGVAIAMRVLHGKKVPRITGVQLFLSLVERAEREGWRVFLLGASQESNTGAAERLQKLHPDLEIVGCRDGYFDEPKGVVEQINASQADLLFVALGSPKQERWITDNRTELAPAFCMGVGGSFDVVSGRAKRAPRVFRNTGTEWLYRLGAEPGRWRRQMVLPAFALRVVMRAARGGKS